MPKLRPREVWLRRVCWVLAIALVVAILYVYIAPSLNLAPCALRAFRAAIVVLICLRLWLYAVGNNGSLIAPLLCGISGWSRREYARLCHECNLLKLHCTRLC
jgi:hypothetical protein